jgi:hypothetical protein
MVARRCGGAVRTHAWLKKYLPSTVRTNYQVPQGSRSIATADGAVAAAPAVRLR